MAKVIVIYKKPTDEENFKNYYENEHIKLVQQVPYIQKADLDYVTAAMNTEESYYLAATIEFESKQRIGEALQSPEWAKVTEDAENMMKFLPEAPLVLITE
ncbi:EthD family reductase [Guptibacillus algicola]|uniref:EthD family reductase n=1 Tax=Guptibacillus algicola TaxID=225844 RepID=UPI001CD69A94|nr:EthD family reductase [Alkalihalobacillus algicola]MCA0986743.1 EthD family reductase [Alkalihalobacillus algicola]